MPDTAPPIVSYQEPERLLPPPEMEVVHEKSWLKNFTRITSSGNYIPEIDGLRFIAVAMVLVYHVQIWVLGALGLDPTDYNKSLVYGVQLFFVISGFILAVPFAAHYTRGTKPVRLKSYFLRRITRLEPPYFIIMTIMACAKAWLIAKYFPRIFVNLGLSLLYIHNAFVGQHSPVSIVAWSLEVEVQFYILMPALAYVFLIRNRWLRRAVIVVPCAILMWWQKIYLPTPMGLVPNESHILNFMQYFAAGILLADVWVTEWANQPPAIKRGLFSIGDFIWVACWPAGLYLAIHHGDIEKFGLPILMLVQIIAMFQSVWARKLMRVPIVAVIGGMCYSIYLVHNPIIQYGGNALIGYLPTGYYSAMIVGSLMMIPIVLFFSAIYFRLIERPCMRRDWWPRFWKAVGQRIFIEEEEPPPAPST